jgi:signal transduction histidine kinase
MLELAENSELVMLDAPNSREILKLRCGRRSLPKRFFSVDHPVFSIVHDLRNPLTAISGCAELLATGKLDAEQTRRIATNVWRASQQMKSLLNGFVSTARELNRQSEFSNLRALLAASCEAAGVSQRTDIDVTIDVSPEIHLRMDCRRMERVFLNVIVNAIEAMPSGGAINIAASVTANRVRITIEDTGPGIPAIIRDRLFEPFATAGKTEGLGIGLAISRQTVRDHGGDLWSEPGRGAHFVMWLPGCRRARRREEPK